jgi:transcriptional regulator with XRE-family HTH domain
MSMKTHDANTDRLREYDNLMLRSAFVSLFWSVIKERRKTRKLTLQQIAEGLGTNKSAVSRWFSNDPPNWRLSTISDMANHLDIDLRIEAHDRATGAVYRPSGVVKPQRIDPTLTVIETDSASPAVKVIKRNPEQKSARIEAA